jgi:outer membrane lipoprotein SlyB
MVKCATRHASKICDFAGAIGYQAPVPGSQVPARGYQASDLKEHRGLIFRFLISALVVAGVSGCGPSYSPDTYASNAAQQANKVEQGVVVGVRNVAVSAAGTVGTLAGAAAGGIAGSEAGVGPVSAFSALGGSLVGGIAGSTVEHVTADTTAFEYIVRKPNGDLVSVTQRDKTPLVLGQKVLVIAGVQARVVPDYTVPPLATPAKTDTPTPGARPADTKPVDAPPGAAQPGTTPPIVAAPGATPPPVLVTPLASPPNVAASGVAAPGTPSAAGSQSGAPAEAAGDAKPSLGQSGDAKAVAAALAGKPAASGKSGDGATP